MSFQGMTREFTLPITESRVLVLQKQADGARAVLMRHLGKSEQTSPATVKFQESQDGSQWYDIAGTIFVVDAGSPASWLITSTKPYVALAGYGNVDVEVAVIRSDPDSTLPQSVNM